MDWVRSQAWWLFTAVVVLYLALVNPWVIFETVGGYPMAAYFPWFFFVVVLLLVGYEFFVSSLERREGGADK